MELSRRCENETKVGKGPNEQERPTSARCPIRPRKRNAWQKVIDLLAMATEEDHKGNYTLALKLYECALEFFLLAIDQGAQCDKATESFVWDSCLECLERVEDLRKRSPI